MMLSRSKYKGPFIERSLLNKIEKGNPKIPIKSYSRKSTIVPKMIGYLIEVHNGKHWMPVLITVEMIGYKLGQFAPTRFYPKHKNKK